MSSARDQARSRRGRGEVEPDVPVGLFRRRLRRSPPRTPGSTWLMMLLAAVLALGAGCATVPTEYREPVTLAAAERATLNAKVFDRAWELVNRKYFDATFRGVDWAGMRVRYRPEALAARDDDGLYRVLNRMCAELKESHLAALTPRRVHERRAEHRAAIGVRWELLEGQRVVTDVVPGGPADRAGIAPGWLVVSRNGAPLREGEVYITRLAEPVTYGFVDPHGTERSFTLEPRLLNFERLESRELRDGYRYLRFDKFSRGTLSWLSDELKTHPDAPGVIIDLRSNHGGNALALTVAVAEFFTKRVPSGQLVRRNGRTKEASSLAWRSARYRGRVVLLTGPETGSAAEIFAHVLQHHGRATVVGRKTAGAVIYSMTYGLPGGGELQVPVTDYVGLDGERLEGRGVAPDVEVRAPTLAERRAQRDPVLEVAREIVRSGR